MHQDHDRLRNRNPAFLDAVVLVLHTWLCTKVKKKKKKKSNYFFLISLTGVITEQTQNSTGPTGSVPAFAKAALFSLQNFFLQDRGCQHLRLWHIEYEFSAHKDFIRRHRLWLSPPSTFALLSGSRGSDQICHGWDHLDWESAGGISTRSLPC